MEERSSHDLVVSVVAQHADSLLRVARRYTACAADAEDAYQRALEIFVKNAGRLDAEGAHKWLHVVVRNEALAVRRSRSSLVSVADEATLDALDDGRHLASVEERSERMDELARAAEALQRLKPQEVTALWLKAEGLSYDEIAERQGWTYTKVNRCITEGRRAFLRRYAGIEAGEECERWAAVLSAMADGEATAQQLLEVRPHLRNCASCRSSLVAMRDGGRAVAALLPPAAPLAAGAGLLAKLATLGGGGSLLPSKLAAVAASTAVLAGGGVALEHRLGDEPARAQERPAAEAAAPRETSAAPLPTPTTPTPSGRELPRAEVPAADPPGAAPRGAADENEAGSGAAFAPEAAPGVTEGAGAGEGAGTLVGSDADAGAREGAGAGHGAGGGAGGGEGAAAGGGAAPAAPEAEPDAEFGFVPEPRRRGGGAPGTSP